MNYRFFGLLITIIINGNAMEVPTMSEKMLSVTGDKTEISVLNENDTLTIALEEIPKEQLEIYKTYYGNKQRIATAVLMHLNTEYSESFIPNKRDRKLEKAIKQYQDNRNKLLYKGIAYALSATGTGYYTQKGCKTPEATVAVGLTSASFALLAFKYGYDWYNACKPTHALIAQYIKQKQNGSSYDVRQSILVKIEKILNPKKSKEKNKK